MFCVNNWNHVAMVVYNGNSLCVECYKEALKKDEKDPWIFQETKEQFDKRMKEEKSMQVAPRR